MEKHSSLEREWAARVLFTLVTDSRSRLEYGAKLREQMMKDINAGKLATGYRPEWIRASSRRVIVLLNGIAGEFNDEYGSDQASLNDLLDIMATAVHMIQRSQAEFEKGGMAKPTAKKEDNPKS